MGLGCKVMLHLWGWLNLIWLKWNGRLFWVVEMPSVWRSFIASLKAVTLRSSWLKKHPSFVAVSSGHIRITWRAFKLWFLSCLLPKYDYLFWGEAHALVLFKHSQVILVQPGLGICGLKESLRGRRKTTLNTRCVVLQHSFSGVIMKIMALTLFCKFGNFETLLNYFSQHHARSSGT